VKAFIPDLNHDGNLDEHINLVCIPHQVTVTNEGLQGFPSKKSNVTLVVNSCILGGIDPTPKPQDTPPPKSLKEPHLVGGKPQSKDPKDPKKNAAKHASFSAKSKNGCFSKSE